MLPDKMAISHSHLFVPVVFVFCFLSPLIHSSDSYDYTDSRHFEKNPTVSKQSNNIQRLPNYNQKPPDKYYGPREETTERNLGMEFTKHEDSEQKMVDPWVKKMQEISRQEREKWAAYRRNVKLTLDNVEETTKAGKLTNDESITLGPTKSLVQYLSANQDNTNVNDSSGNRFHSFWSNLKQYADTNVDGVNKKLKNNEWSTDIKNSSVKFLQKVPITVIHQRHKDYEISNIKENPFFKRNATDYEKSELEEDHLSSIINLHPEQSILQQQFKNSYILKSGTSAHKNITKSSANDKNLNHTNGSKQSPKKKYLWQFNFSRSNKKESSNDNKEDEEKTTNSLIRKNKNNDNVNPEELILQQSKTLHVPESSVNKIFKKFFETNKNLNHKTDSKFLMKKYPRQSRIFQNDNKENNENNKKGDEKTITGKSLMWKNKEEKHDAREKDMTEKLNHERSFHSGRWGMSVSSPPVEFLNDMFQRSMHRKNEKQIEKDGKHHLFGRWGMSIASSPPEFFEDISIYPGHETDRFIAKTGSRPNEGKESFDDRSSIHQSHQNLQTTLVQQLIADEHYKKLVRTLLGRVPNGLYDSRYRRPNYWNNYPTNTDFNNGLFLGFLQALSYVWENNMDIQMTCRIQIPYTLSRI